MTHDVVRDRRVYIFLKCKLITFVFFVFLIIMKTGSGNSILYNLAIKHICTNI